ncbi:(R)-benzylsuccinyl-CoA dehydrogenase [Rhodobacteraceae bacterium THAF1]|uniref:acyl-CoA dehydrogenase family protein n=1 Tax=Palleronia sp. THAF1 TaxID=2587842 RepID=UPI000F3CBE8B|nr:acyl-CoA dehydrogenase [Palleronia sp. THAF1]QFU07888.1 (R)-benzylsuccinyl-CoA dehydrogenase [Palleronia sp. THAF1]VDC25722.1 (R)-benzylsuccinyl-CoA dehydrogenase [Rhodobacteraceae bacterium THAF1]
MTPLDQITGLSDQARDIADRVEHFVRNTVIPMEKDARQDGHGPSDELVDEIRDLARDQGLLTPHIKDDGTPFTHRETTAILIRSGLSTLGMLGLNTSAPDEGNIYLLHKVGSPELKERFLKPMVDGRARSAFFMTEPADWGGAGSDPMMMKTTCKADGNHWVVNGRKTYITGVDGAKVGIVMAKAEEGACMFLVDLPDPAIKIVRKLDTIDSSLPGGHCEIEIDNLRIPADQMLGEPGEGFKYAQVRLAPARLTHCMRWLGACYRSQEIATNYTCRRHAFGKPLIEHEGVGFQLAENRIDLQQAELMTFWCADVLDRGERGTTESSMTKVAVSEALMRVADRCVQVMGGQGVTGDTPVERIFREIRAFRIYDGPTEVHKWSLSKKIQRDWQKMQDSTT